jgi:hypothetical protein
VFAQRASSDASHSSDPEQSCRAKKKLGYSGG